GPMDAAIDQLISLAGGIANADLVREIILTALKAGQEEKEDKADLKLMNSTMKEMRFTSKIFGPYKAIRKVTVFGSARTCPEEPVYQMARLLGKNLAGAGYMVITGGGPGIMQAVNEGAGPEHSFGVNIRLPFEQRANPVLEGNPRLILYKYFFNRKIAFIKEAHAIVLFPGGFGTLDEAMETLTLVQTGKRDPIPLILVDEPGGTYWSDYIRFFHEKLLAEGYISDSDFFFFTLVDSVEDVVEIIRRFYHRYHSLRYVDGRLVIRLGSPIDRESLKTLRESFSDILVPQGEMRLSGPLPAEADEPEIAHIPRLLIDFDRKSFGRLRSLIDALNSF
ncbi:MAG TPA: TIGR00730 family Rossman fold protein, partial [Thermodesulfovibrionales bacterium]|nr:TIGR00730 family Rossman fold protein [Thermodesulfovibrionales bacterium]